MKMMWMEYLESLNDIKGISDAWTSYFDNMFDRHCRIATVTLKEGHGG